MLPRPVSLPSPRRIHAAVVMVLLALAAPVRGGAQNVAVVVNPANSLSDLSLDKLRRLYLGQTRTFPDGSHARLGRHTPSASVFDRSALGLQPDIVRSRWMAMIFRGEQTTLPAELATADDVKRFVKEHPDAIAFLPSAQGDASVKIVAIDGKRPGDAGYTIH